MAEDNTTYEYTCGDQTGFEYYVLGDDIRKEFDFLKSSGTGNSTIAGNLDEMLKHLKVATSNTDAFYFENNGAVSDINHVYEEINQDVSKLKSQLDTLHAAFMTDIDNINAELEVNFGHWVGYKVNGK